jgi:hypothetical protein
MTTLPATLPALTRSERAALRARGLDALDIGTLDMLRASGGRQALARLAFPDSVPVLLAAGLVRLIGDRNHQIVRLSS